jgi:hypothetical protein
MVTEKEDKPVFKNSPLAGAKKWGNKPDIDPELAKAYIEKGEKYLNYTWESLPVTVYMDFARNGDRSRYEKIYFNRRNVLGSLLMAECIEGKKRFLDDIINGLWLICEETSWVVPAHNNHHNNSGKKWACPQDDPMYIDLFAAETGALMSWVLYILEAPLEEETPLLTIRLKRELKRRIIDPFLNGDFAWMGLNKTGAGVNNWTPWCIGNCMTAAILTQSDDIADAVCKKGLIGLNSFLSSYHDDGCCDEGPSYWGVAGGALIDCLEILYTASDGKMDIYNDPLVINIGKYIHRVYIKNGWVVNYADGGARMGLHPITLWFYGSRINDGAMKALAKMELLKNKNKIYGGSWYPFFREYSYATKYNEIINYSEPLELERESIFDGTQVISARENTEMTGFFLSAKGGHNSESHNHNDVGSFIVFHGAEPVFVDAGVENYSEKTFSSRRYEIWTMQSSWHNPPEINGMQQLPGGNHRAENVSFISTDSKVSIAMNIEKAYPESCGLKSWRRKISLNRSADTNITINDSAEGENLAITFNFLTYPKPELSDNKICFTLSDGKKIYMNIDISSPYKVEIEEKEITDSRLIPVWGKKLYRIRINAEKTNNLKANFKIYN